MIRSATTVWNLSKPKTSRSKQARLHRGSGLFCIRAPYKADDKHNENTHHRRAFKKNIRDFFFSSVMESERKHCLMRSIDDKAYLRPGTSEGFNSVRNNRIFTPTAKDQMRKLPKYDWHVKSVYQTPSTHRLLMLESFQVDGHEKIGSSGDSHYVFVRPKSYVDSSSTTWASETVWLRHNFPSDFEVNEQSSRSIMFRKILAVLHDYAYQFQDMTMKEDLNKVTPGNLQCVHTVYELRRLEHLISGIVKVTAMSYSPQLKVAEREIITALRVEELSEILKKTQKSFPDYTKLEEINKAYESISQKLEITLEEISGLNLKPVRPRWCDLTDGGPGVAVSNFDVHFRDAEMAKMWNSDYRIWLHLSRNDNYSNEAERTNSAIGDSIVDGQTIEWEHIKLFDGISDESISNDSSRI